MHDSRQKGEPDRISAHEEHGVLAFFSGTVRAFRYRDFRWMWLGAFTSTTGTWMQQVAESWVVLALTGSAFYLGLTAFLGQLPIILFSLVGGVIADRFDRLWWRVRQYVFGEQKPRGAKMV